MKKHKKKAIRLSIPHGYTLEELYETDDSAFIGEEPALTEEVKWEFERVHNQEK